MIGVRIGIIITSTSMEKSMSTANKFRYCLVSLMTLGLLIGGCSSGHPQVQPISSRFTPAKQMGASTQRTLPVVPDPLVMFDGRPVTDKRMWVDQRRPELLGFFESHVYGVSPPSPKDAVYTVESVDDAALGGKAVHKEIAMTFTGNGKTVVWHMTEYLPGHAVGPVPVILGLNFAGNQTICDDPGIPLRMVWTRKSKAGPMRPGPATQPSRGRETSQWQLDQILAHGYGLATIYYFDIEPDAPEGPAMGIRSLYQDLATTKPAADQWGAIAAWAWGLSRGLDALATDPAVDAKRVIVFGHSRLGKAAVWAGASDPRFAAVISNESGCGGAAVLREKQGENIGRITSKFPSWFCGNFKAYAGHEAQMPTDQHEMVALIAPRPVYIASADSDSNSDPFSEFASAVRADPVWRLLGADGFGVTAMPALNTSVGHTIRYHDRTGKHDVKAFDWEQYLPFLDEEVGGEGRE
jgi:hypothetical protein